MNELLNKLADTLDISNKGLEKVIETVGGVNYADVYQQLLREYTFYSLSNSLGNIGFFLLLVCGGPYLWAFLVDIFKEEGFSKRFNILKYLALLGVVLLIVSTFSVVFYPNINLILALIGDE